MFNQSISPQLHIETFNAAEGSIFCSRDEIKTIADLDSQAVDFLVIGSSNEGLISHLIEMGYNVVVMPKMITVIASDIDRLTNRKRLSAVLLPGDEFNQQEIKLLKKLKRLPALQQIPLIGIGASRNQLDKSLYKLLDDYFKFPFETLGRFGRRVSFLRDLKKKRSSYQPIEEINFKKMPTGKRVFDVFTSALLLLLSSPLLLLIAILIKLESRGPVFYIAKRAGSGFDIFDFYKFRSMKIGADKEIKKLQHLNQYSNGSSTFFKVSNDPRITRIGRFLRNTSLDELPQLFNVLKGDMSMVGNRPLPLYEAEELTTDEFSKRFVGPAGITGLWQVSKRGQKEMSDAERINLDVSYSYQYSFWMDFKILLMTFPAMFQRESV